jgi:hypothetical protein
MSRTRQRAGDKETNKEATEARKRRSAALRANAHAGMALWQLCPHKDCRRLRGCGGDVDLCGMYRAPMAWSWVGHAVAAIRAGASPRTAKRAAERMVPRKRFTLVTKRPDGGRQLWVRTDEGAMAPIDGPLPPTRWALQLRRLVGRRGHCLRDEPRLGARA